MLGYSDNEVILNKASAWKNGGIEYLLNSNDKNGNSMFGTFLYTTILQIKHFSIGFIFIVVVIVCVYAILPDSTENGTSNDTAIAQCERFSLLQSILFESNRRVRAVNYTVTYLIEWNSKVNNTISIEISLWRLQIYKRKNTHRRKVYQDDHKWSVWSYSSHRRKRKHAVLFVCDISASQHVLWTNLCLLLFLR